MLIKLCDMSEAIDYDTDTLCSVKSLLLGACSPTSYVVAPQPETDLDELISLARKEAESDTKFQDFSAWHQYSLLLFRRAHGLCQQKSTELPGSIEECRKALIGALRSGRSAKTSKSTNLALGGRIIHSASGFQTAEADSDFILLQNLSVLGEPQADYLGCLNVAVALCELSEMDLATAHAEVP